MNKIVNKFLLAEDKFIDHLLNTVKGFKKSKIQVI